ncbi:unnamed protein product [Adineta steineri]|uniref:Uncharacterized protein n=1 Tax=Adineta steineri TaxID=433720 RepID=A0A819R428_9BILA|nr:unnamed protein product [Adineta steineri]
MNNYRYHDLVQRFALALYILGGKYTYDFVRLNLICALPCPTTITSLIKQSNFKLNESEFRFNFLQEHFISKNIKYSFVSEDSTAVVKKIVYDTATNSFVGFCTPLNNGIPIPHYFRTESFDQLKEWFDSIQKAGFLNLHMIQPISESIANSSPFILSAYGTDNKFTLYDIVRKWVYIFNECSSRHIRIVGYATGMHQFQFQPIPIPILELELVGIGRIGIGIGWNWLELELELVGIGWNWNWNWSELVKNWSELVGIGQELVGIDMELIQNN